METVCRIQGIDNAVVRRIGHDIQHPTAQTLFRHRILDRIELVTVYAGQLLRVFLADALGGRGAKALEKTGHAGGARQKLSVSWHVPGCVRLPGGILQWTNAHLLERNCFCLASRRDPQVLLAAQFPLSLSASRIPALR